MKSGLICSSVSKTAWNDETSVFENEDLKVVITLKDQSIHGGVKVGDEFPFEMKFTKPKKPAAKKATAKKPATKTTAKKTAAKKVETPTV